MRVLTGLLILMLAGCAAQAPIGTPQPQQTPTSAGNSSSRTEFLVAVTKALDPLQGELDKPLAESDRSLVDVERASLTYVLGSPGESSIPEPLKLLAKSVFWRLNRARTVSQEPITLEFREGHTAGIQADGHKILVSAGALAMLSSSEDFARALAFEIAVIDGDVADLRYQVGRLRRSVTPALTPIQIPAEMNMDTATLIQRGMIALLANRLAPFEAEACALRRRAGFSCPSVTTDGSDIHSKLMESNNVVNGVYPYVFQVSLTDPVIKGPATRNSKYEAAWVKSSEGMRFGPSYDDLGGLEQELVSRRDGVSFKLNWGITRSFYTAQGSGSTKLDDTSGVLGAQVISRGALVAVDGGLIGYVVGVPTAELISAKAFGEVLRSGSFPILGKTAAWSAHSIGGQNTVVARWAHGPRTYEIYLTGAVETETIVQRIRTLFERLYIDDSARLMELRPERFIAIWQSDSRADAKAQEGQSARIMAFGRPRTQTFLMLNTAETLDDLPDYPSLIRYLR
jgi:hypothetical protein